MTTYTQLTQPLSQTYAGIISKMQTTLVTGGKHSGQSLAAINVTGLDHSPLFYIIDARTNLHFLVDTGAEVSIKPSTSTDKNNCCYLTLQAVNNFFNL